VFRFAQSLEAIGSLLPQEFVPDALMDWLIVIDDTETFEQLRPYRTYRIQLVEELVGLRPRVSD